MVDEAGITPLPRHVATVQDCPPLTDIKQLQRFLGLINFYRLFSQLWPALSNLSRIC
jgi:hypothetical protein